MGSSFRGRSWYVPPAGESQNPYGTLLTGSPFRFASSAKGEAENYSDVEHAIFVSLCGIGKIASNSESERIGAEAYL